MHKKHLMKFNIHSWYLKKMSKLGMRIDFFNLINGIYEKPTVYIILDSK